MLHSELTGEVSKELEESEKIKYSEDVDRLRKAIDSMEKEVTENKEDHESRMEVAKQQYSNVLDKLNRITHKLMASDKQRLILIFMLKRPVTYLMLLPL